MVCDCFAYSAGLAGAELDYLSMLSLHLVFLARSGGFLSQPFAGESRMVISEYSIRNCEVREYWIMESSMHLYSFIRPESFRTIRLSLLFSITVFLKSHSTIYPV